MTRKTSSILFTILMILCLAAVASAQTGEDYFDETWSEDTVLTVFNDVDFVFPDLFADEDSDFLWAEGYQYYPYMPSFPKDFKTGEYLSKAPVAEGILSTEEAPVYADMQGSYDPCGDGTIAFDVTLTKATQDEALAANFYYGDLNKTHIRSISVYTSIMVGGNEMILPLSLSKCETTGGDNCRAVSFRYNKNTGKYEAHVKGTLNVPIIVPIDSEIKVSMVINFSVYKTALWPVNNTVGDHYDTGYVVAQGSIAPSSKNYCESSVELYDGLGYETRGKYDPNTGEARLWAVLRNNQKDLKKVVWITPQEIFALPLPPISAGSDIISISPSQRATSYTCKYTLYNSQNGHPRTDYCKFGEKIYLPPEAVIRFDLTVDHLSGAILRAADGNDIPYLFRVKGMPRLISGSFEVTDNPCPPVRRLEVRNPLKPFVNFYFYEPDSAIPGYNGIYNNGLWGMYQKCGKMAYMAIRLRNEGVRDEIIDLSQAEVAINGGKPMRWHWVLTTMEPENKDKIRLQGGEEVILFGKAKVTDIPYQMNSDEAYSGAISFPYLDLYITGKVYSDHNNTNCTEPPK